MLFAPTLPVPIPDAPFSLFLDIDGTLAPLASTPQEAAIPLETLALLESLRGISEGAVALISGRNLFDIDRMSGANFPAAGQHGLEIRNAAGIVEASHFHAHVIARVEQELQKLVTKHPLLVLEAKGLCVALHYRRAPELGPMVLTMLNEIKFRYANILCLQHGKMVGELRLAQGSKGEAIQRLMQTLPFAGKIPVFAGDDVTDETAFAAVNALGGISIKIGEGDTAAMWRLASVEDFAAWLHALAMSFSQQGEAA